MSNKPSMAFNDVVSTPEFEEAKECVGRAFERMEDILSSCIASVCTEPTEGKEIVSVRLNDSLFRLLAIVRKGKALAATVTAQGQNPVIVKDSPAFRFVR
ncbi:hypothetical protein NB636_07270 [Oxalobacter aliiformigenes]|uniref:hypothetical protein n=1 Tax=Oxalobacter aliiformigenes TaxID=2946593 RepID=UPI0022AFF683|nr:hypothetical protein [Oxalobacter aliiformigenes]MCZ4063897.1 hypothetical protein [Oxalobacter aliiformigenes]WAV98519.1 hypothetical protein NB636_07270 [Oxalobacter aliiformigenes]